MGVIIDEVVGEVEPEESGRAEAEGTSESGEPSPQLEAAQLARLLAHLDSRRQRLHAD